jgi:hypothetical protein
VRRALTPGDLRSAELGVYSQNGEDGVLQALLHHLGPGRRFFVEFGAGAGAEANCVLLADHYGWSGLLIESDQEAYAGLAAKYAGIPRVRTVNAAVRADNVERLFGEAGVPEVFDVLSIDIDGNDYWVWQAIGAFSPRIVIAEYNGSFPAERQFVMPRDDHHAWDATDYFGASLGALRALATEKGYALVHLEASGVNAFFARADEWRALEAPPAGCLAVTGGVRLPPDPRRRPFLDLERGTLVDAERLPLA